MCHLCGEGRPHLSRRQMLGGGLAAGAMLGLGRPAVASGAVTPGLDPDEALGRLMQGNARYVGGTPANRDYAPGRTERTRGQHPIAAVLACADSRVSPELFFDQGPGELFIVRVAGNFVEEDGLASLEYAVRYLGVRLLLVLGHSSCGAIAATINVLTRNARLPGHLPGLAKAIKPGVQAAIARKPADLLLEATHENVRHNVRRLQRAKPVIDRLVAGGSVKVAGGHYDIATDVVTLL